MRKSSATRDSSSSVTSSTNSSSNPRVSDSPALLARSICSSSSTAMRPSSNLHTDLSLGLGISTTTTSNFSPGYCENDTSGDNSLFVKVNMEGSKIGRKIDVLALHGYPHLINTLQHMFNTPNILWAEGEQDSHQNRYCSSHVLTYEDRDGDWMMVGDVPWELFLTAVKRLKITSTSHS